MADETREVEEVDVHERVARGDEAQDAFEGAVIQRRQRELVVDARSREHRAVLRAAQERQVALHAVHQLPLGDVLDAHRALDRVAHAARVRERLLRHRLQREPPQRERLLRRVRVVDEAHARLLQLTLCIV